MIQDEGIEEEYNIECCLIEGSRQVTCVGCHLIVCNFSDMSCGLAVIN